MKHLSWWASRNPAPARIIIVTGHFTLILLAFLVTRQLYSLEYTIPDQFLSGSLIIFLLACILYPERKKKINNDQHRTINPYLLRKSCDFFILLTSFISVCYIFSSGFRQPALEQIQASVIIKDSSIYKYPSTRQILSSQKDGTKKKLTKSERSILKKELKHQFRQLSKNQPDEDENGKTGRVLLIILSILVALGLIFLLAALACQISCGGAEALAILVFVLGLAGIIFLLIYVIKAILRKKNDLPKENTQSPVSSKKRNPIIGMVR